MRRFLLGCVWTAAIVLGVVAGEEGDPDPVGNGIYLTAALIPFSYLVGAMRHVRYVRSRGEDLEPRDFSRKPRRDISLPGVEMAQALAMVRNLDRDSVLTVDEQVDGGFVVTAKRGGTWSRATAHVLVAAQPSDDGVDGVRMRIEGSISIMQGTDDSRAFLLVLQLRDRFIDELRAYLISPPGSPRAPETADR